jgi:hypothetical protein
MMTLVYGVSTMEELRQRIGNVRQIAGYQRVQLQEGKGKGNEVLLVRNGCGLSFQISLSRAFDIGLCELYGIPVSWMSAAGPVSPHFYEKDGREWSRGFEGGLLATGGLTYMGKPNVDEFRRHQQSCYVRKSCQRTLATHANFVDAYGNRQPVVKISFCCARSVPH